MIIGILLSVIVILIILNEIRVSRLKANVRSKNNELYKALLELHSSDGVTLDEPYLSMYVKVTQ